MPNYIQVTNLKNNTVWEKQLTADEYKRIRDLTQSANRVSVIPATLKPVRTNNFKNFAKDFFLPTTVNHAIKVHHTVGKVFAILGALILDTLTFPIRLLTSLPRVISNARKPENPLHKYLKSEGVDKKLLASDHVRVKFGWETTSSFLNIEPDEHGNVHHKYAQKQNLSEEDVNFIERPDFGSHASYEYYTI